LDGTRPENYLPILLSLKDTVNFHSGSGKQVWITEGAIRDTTRDGRLIRAAIARLYLIMVISGIDNYMWYYWENALPDSERPAIPISKGRFNTQIADGGKAYQAIARWLTGSTPIYVKKLESQGVWDLGLMAHNNEHIRIVWREEGESKLPSAELEKISKITYIDGSFISTRKGIEAFKIGIEPVLLSVSGF
jgi:hypothetical protein